MVTRSESNGGGSQENKAAASCLGGGRPVVAVFDKDGPGVVYARENGGENDKSTRYADDEEAIADLVAESDLSNLEADMLAEFDWILLGYFEDEEAETVAQR